MNMQPKVIALSHKQLPGIIDIHAHFFPHQQMPFAGLGNLLDNRKESDTFVDKLIAVFTSKKLTARLQDTAADYAQDDPMEIIRSYYQVNAALGLVGSPTALAGQLYMCGLLMNFDHAGFTMYTAAKEDFQKQLDAAYAMVAPFAGPGNMDIIPSLGADPRDGQLLARLGTHVSRGFNLIKMYPALGIAVDDPQLIGSFYPAVIKNKCSIVTHCSPGGFQTLQNKIKAYNYKTGKHEMINFTPSLFGSIDKRDWFNAPRNWKRMMGVLAAHVDGGRNLHVDLAHFGGGSHINRFMDGKKDSYVWDIIDLCMSPDYPNFYTDISSAISKGERLKPFLERVITRYPGMENKILYGTDSYILKLSVDLQWAIKTFFDGWQSEPAMLRKFVYENPIRFLQKTEKDFPG